MLLFVDCDLMLLVLLQRLDSPMALLGNISKDDGDICFDMHGEDDVPGTSLNGKKAKPTENDILEEMAFLSWSTNQWK